jgi:hypothetical protein
MPGQQRFRDLFRSRVHLVLLAPVVALALWACGAHPLAQPAPVPEAQTDRIYEVNPLRQLDLIFVIDNSNSMEQEQENLRRNFPAFMRALERIEGGLPDIRIAVISSNFGAGPTSPADECPVFGDRGQFQVRPGCGLDPAQNGTFVAIDGAGNKNFQGELSTVFSCLASLGTGGCGYEHPLQSLRAALAASDPTSGIAPANRNFLRKDAFLGIVILSDEDDCSGEPEATFYRDPVPGQAGSLRCALLGHVCGDQPVPPSATFRAPLSSCRPYQRRPDERASRLINVQDFVDYILAIKGGNQQRVIVSSIIGLNDAAQASYGLFERELNSGGRELDLLPACNQGQAGVATPGIRLRHFTGSFLNNTVHSICQPDLSVAMEQIGDKMKRVLENTCITAALVDTDLERPGLQADCQVRDRVPRSGGGFVDQPLPGCDGGTRSPCWELTPAPECAGGYRTSVRRPDDMLPPPDTLQVVQCLTCTAGADPRRCPAPRP